MRRLYAYLQDGEGLRVAVCDDSVLHASRSDGAAAFFFPSGATVFWGFSRAERLALLEGVRPFDGNTGLGGQSSPKAGSGSSRPQQALLPVSAFRHEFRVRQYSDEDRSIADGAAEAAGGEGTADHNAPGTAGTLAGTHYDLDTDVIVLRGWQGGGGSTSSGEGGSSTALSLSHGLRDSQTDLDSAVDESGESRFPRHVAYSNRVMEMLAISHVLAQSCKLLVFEEEMEQLTLLTERLPRESEAFLCCTYMPAID